MKTSRSFPPYYDCLQSFLSELERRDDLVRIKRPVSLVQEITEIHKRVLEVDGPALIFEQPVDADGRQHSIPLVANLFGSKRRIALGLGRSPEEMPDLAEMLAELRAPKPPRSAGEIWSTLPLAKAALNMRPRHVRRAPVQAAILEGEVVNLDL